MGWTLQWVSSYGNDFNYDFHVSFTKEELAKGKVDYNYGMVEDYDELPGLSVFSKDEAGDVFHTYSSYARGNEKVIGAYIYLDITPRAQRERNHGLGAAPRRVRTRGRLSRFGAEVSS